MKLSETADAIGFDCFAVDRKAHLLLRDGERIVIQEQPFQVLLALLEVPGEVVTREALRHRLWGADTFVDFNQSMNSAVRRLRHALGDDPEYPRYIETIPRIGYRFIGTLTAPAAAPNGSLRTDPAVVETHKRFWPVFNVARFRWRDPVVVVWLLVVFAGSTLLPWEVRSENQTAKRLQSDQSGPAQAGPEIAVVPLRNLTGTNDDQYVADGMTDAVTTKLVEHSGLRVMSQPLPVRNGDTPEALARQLKIGSVVEGSIRRQGDQLWITTRLIDTKHGTYLWADTYTGSAHDLAKDEISVAEEIARQVDSHLTGHPATAGK